MRLEKWLLAGVGAGNTLDLAYDQGGPGAGRVINVDAGELEFIPNGNPAILIDNQAPNPVQTWGANMVSVQTEIQAIGGGTVNSYYTDINEIGACPLTNIWGIYNTSSLLTGSTSFYIGHYIHVTGDRDMGQITALDWYRCSLDLNHANEKFYARRTWLTMTNTLSNTLYGHLIDMDGIVLTTVPTNYAGIRIEIASTHASADIDTHIRIREDADPPTPANAGAIYTKDDAGTTQLFFREDNSGAVYQLTPLPAPAGVCNYACRVYTNDAAQLIPAGVWTSVTYELENFDPDAMHHTVVNNTRIYIKHDGKYELDAACRWLPGPGRTYMRFLLNGITPLAQAGDTRTEGVEEVLNDINDVEDLVVGDYIEVQVWHSGGFALGFHLAPTPRAFNWFGVASVCGTGPQGPIGPGGSGFVGLHGGTNNIDYQRFDLYNGYWVWDLALSTSVDESFGWVSGGTGMDVPNTYLQLWNATNGECFTHQNWGGYAPNAHTAPLTAHALMFSGIHSVSGSGAYAHFGFYKGTGHNPHVEGAYFRWDDTVGAVWLCITRDVGGETLTNTGVAMGYGVIKKMNVIIDNNVTPKTAKFYMNDVLVATHNTNTAWTVNDTYHWGNYGLRGGSSPNNIALANRFPWIFSLEKV